MAAPELEDFGGGFNQLYGIELVEYSDDEVRARVPVHEGLMQPLGIVHGGVFASMAETMASAWTWWANRDQGKWVAGLSNSTSFVRPITQGSINGVARPRHRGRTTWVWDVEIHDDQERLCALTRMTVAVRDAPATSR